MKIGDTITHVNRRAVLGGALAATATPAISLPEAANTPILRLFREHQAIIDAANAYVPGGSESEDEELERLFYRRSDQLEADIMSQPSTSAADFAAKAIVDTGRGRYLTDWESGEVWKEARRLTGTGELAVATEPRSSEIGLLYREWTEVLTAWDEGPSLSDEQAAAICNHLHALEMRVSEIPANTIEDLAAKVLMIAAGERGEVAFQGKLGSQILAEDAERIVGAAKLSAVAAA